jgi:hypothetical protein
MTLDDAIATLYVREINCGCETFWDGGIKVWIGDMMNATAPRRYSAGTTWARRGNGSSTKRPGFSRRRSNRHAALLPQSH